MKLPILDILENSGNMKMEDMAEEIFSKIIENSFGSDAILA